MAQQRAYLYIRVSTDEQADKGYSQRHQDEQLRKYCEHHNIAIAGVYWEDYSGKTFDRPEFNTFLQHPLPLQKLRRYYGLIRPRTGHRYSSRGVSTCAFPLISLFEFPCSDTPHR